jgi:hypothetical protein
MSENIISHEEALLLLHRFISERLPVDVWFSSADGFVIANMEGFIGSIKGGELHVVTDLASVGSFLTLRHASSFTAEYADSTDLPDSKFSLGLRLIFQNGDKLTIMEKKEEK